VAANVVRVCLGTARPPPAGSGGEDDLMNRRLPSRRKNQETEDRPGGAAKLGPDAKAKIGQHLRVMYAEIVDQGVPNRFVEILRRLDEPLENEGSKNGAS
jgi:hypothetical protein